MHTAYTESRPAMQLADPALQVFRLMTAFANWDDTKSIDIYSANIAQNEQRIRHPRGPWCNHCTLHQPYARIWHFVSGRSGGNNQQFLGFKTEGPQVHMRLIYMQDY